MIPNASCIARSFVKNDKPSMIYTNDEADKSERRKNFYLSVYLLPVLAAGVLAGLVYLAYSSGYIARGDMGYGCVISFTAATLIFGFNRRHWLKMPDGTYHNIKGIPPTPKIIVSEPAVYENEYFYSKKDKIGTLISGLFLIGISVWMSQKGVKIILVPIVSAITGLFIFYFGLKAFLDKTAKLKIAKNGLWTKKLGFVRWDDINYADVVIDKKGQHPQPYLEIRLKGTKFEEANQPDERLLLGDLRNHSDIEMIINQSITDYNHRKAEAAGNMG